MHRNIGRYAVCGAGRIGRITRSDRRGFHGVGLDGRVWFSRSPRLIRPNDAERVAGLFPNAIFAKVMNALHVEDVGADTPHVEDVGFRA